MKTVKFRTTSNTACYIKSASITKAIQKAETLCKALDMPIENLIYVKEVLDAPMGDTSA